MGLFYDINNVGDALKTVANTMIYSLKIKPTVTVCYCM